MSDSSFHYPITLVSQNRALLPQFLPLVLLILLPVAYATLLTWQEYLRLTVIAIFIGIFVWRRYKISESEFSNQLSNIVLVLGLCFIVTQFDPALSAHTEIASEFYSNAFFVVSALLVTIAFMAFLFSPAPWGKISFVDWAVVGTLFLVIGLAFGSSLLLESPFAWPILVKCVLYGMIWFTVTRWVSTEPRLEKSLLWCLPVVFAIVCVVGMFRIGVAIYHYQAGEWAQQKQEYDRAVEHFNLSANAGEALQLNMLYDASIFAKAELLYRQGDVSGAAQTLSMEDGFVVPVQANTWEGPSGGDLYTNISCWKDLILYEGKAEIRIFARGDVALGIWPRMRVKLGNKVLGEVEVDASEIRPYVFEIPVSRGRQRLEVVFINDYFNPPENRNLWVEQAEIRYLELAWR